VGTILSLWYLRKARDATKGKDQEKKSPIWMIILHLSEDPSISFGEIAISKVKKSVKG